MFYYKKNQLLDLMQKRQSPLISGSASSSGAKATQRVDMFHLSGPAQLLAQGFIANLPLLTIKQTVTRVGNSYSVPGLDLSQPCFSARLALEVGRCLAPGLEGGRELLPARMSIGTSQVHRRLLPRQKPTPLFLPGKSCGQKRLEGYSPRVAKESDVT